MNRFLRPLATGRNHTAKMSEFQKPTRAMRLFYFDSRKKTYPRLGFSTGVMPGWFIRSVPARTSVSRCRARNHANKTTKNCWLASQPATAIQRSYCISSVVCSKFRAEVRDSHRECAPRLRPHHWRLFEFVGGNGDSSDRSAREGRDERRFCVLS